MNPSLNDLAVRVRSVKASLLLAGMNVSKDVVIIPKELAGDYPEIYKTLVIPADVETYYYSRPLTDQPVIRGVNCRLCETRILLVKARWVFGNKETIPICENCHSKGDY